MAAIDVLLEQALRLSDADRGKLAAHLLRSLEPDDEDDVSSEEWQTAWSTEIDRRVHQIDDGSAELIDGDAALADGRAWLDARRR